MNRIRVLIADMPQLMTDIVEQVISMQPDIELAGSVAGVTAVERALRGSRVDVLVCHLDGRELPASHRALFDARPHLRLLTIDAGDRSGSIYELRLARTALDVGPQGLVDAIRTSARSTRSFRSVPHAADQ